MRDDQLQAGLAMLRAGVDAVLAADLSALSAVELTGLVREVEVQRRRLEAVDHRQLAEVEQRNVAGEYGRTSTADLLVELLRVAPGEAKARVHAARDLGPRRAVTGETLPALFPQVAAAVSDGTVGAGQTRVIRRCLNTLPPHLDGPVLQQAEQALLHAASQVDARRLGQVAERLLAHLDPDGVEPREQRAQRLRGFSLIRHPDGSATPTGLLTPATTAVWQPILDALSAPHTDRDTNTNTDTNTDTDTDTGGVGERDDRSAAQRRHDALLDAGLRLLRSATLPDSGGVPVTILARIDADQLHTQLHEQVPEQVPEQVRDGRGDRCCDRGGHGPDTHAGVAVTGTGDLLPISELLQLACEADIIPVVLNHTGAILGYGRTRRLASPAQRHALALRDGGCSFPGCTRPATWCQTHHITAWQHGGATDLDNLCLLCPYHHREFQARGWQVRISNGVPEWIPPAWLDPTEKPRRNTAHHPPDIDFDVGLAG